MLITVATVSGDLATFSIALLSLYVGLLSVVRHGAVFGGWGYFALGMILFAFTKHDQPMDALLVGSGVGMMGLLILDLLHYRWYAYTKADGLGVLFFVIGVVLLLEGQGVLGPLLSLMTGNTP